MNNVRTARRGVLQRRLGLLVAAAVGVSAATVAAAPPRTQSPECLHASNDFDRDGTADPIIGMPGAAKASGAVQVRISNEGDPYVIEVANPHPEAGARFGTAFTQLSSYADEGQDRLCSQLVVGAPGATSGRGSVSVFTFDEAERRFDERVWLRPGFNNLGNVGGGFGSALSAPFRVADEVDPTPDTLWIGSPDAANVGYGTRRAGLVTGVELAPDSDVPVRTDTFWYPGKGATNGRLGASIVQHDGDIFVGAPGYALGDKERGGGVVMLVTQDEAVIYDWATISQDDYNVPDTSEKGDEFGAALAIDEGEDADPFRLVVGMPGESIGGLKAAGRVVVLTYEAQNEIVSAGWFNQKDGKSYAGFGTAESGDRFGSSVWVPRDGKLNLFSEYLVAAPGEDVGTLKDAGQVATLAGGRGWTQDSAGVPGKAEAGDRMGASLAEGLVGVPGENDGRGMVISGLGGTDPITGFTALTPQAGDQFGAAVG